MVSSSRLAVLGIACACTVLICAKGNAAPIAFQKPALDVPRLEFVTFWGEPYPYGYVYHRPSRECWERREVEGFFEHHYEMVWVCEDRGNGVTARY